MVPYCLPALAVWRAQPYLTALPQAIIIKIHVVSEVHYCTRQQYHVEHYCTIDIVMPYIVSYLIDHEVNTQLVSLSCFRLLRAFSPSMSARSWQPARWFCLRPRLVSPAALRLSMKQTCFFLHERALAAQSGGKNCSPAPDLVL